MSIWDIRVHKSNWFCSAVHPLLQISIPPLTSSATALTNKKLLTADVCLSPSLTVPLESDDFAFYLEGEGRCLGVQDHSLVLSPSCEEPNQRWKWMARRRLFNLGSSLCLGVTANNGTSRWDKYPLGVYTCDREPPRVRWTWNCGQVLDNFNSYFPSDLPSIWNVSVVRPNFKWILHGGLQDLCSRTYQGGCDGNHTSSHAHSKYLSNGSLSVLFFI